MKKPKELKSKSIFLGRYWLELTKNGSLIIMPRMHHSSNPGTPAGINIIRYSPLHLAIHVHEKGVSKSKRSR